MNNGANDTTNNQMIPGVKVAMPSAEPVDASTADAGAAVSNAQQINAQPIITAVQPIANQQTNNTVTTNTPILHANTNQVVQSTAVQTATPVVSSVNANASIQQTVSPTITTDLNSQKIENSSKKEKVKKPKNKLVSVLLFIIVILVVALGGLFLYHQQQLNLMRIKCTPVSTNGESKKLDLESTIVKDLYNKVSTTIREDLGMVELNDQMKLYLAFRQIANTDLYDSNCNKFNGVSMEPFTCVSSSSFVPKAFKVENLQTEVKKLFGEDTNIPNQNIQLGTSCIGGYQYIEERGEFVQGQCASTGTTLYRVEKELVDATSTESTIVLTEKVKYYGSEALNLPEKLVSGTYKYTFKLDMNYNYIYVSKELAN